MNLKKSKVDFAHVRQNEKNMLLRAKERLKAFFACNEVGIKHLAILASILYAFGAIWALWLKFNDNQSIILGYRWLQKMSIWERFLYDLVPFNIRFDFDGQFGEILANCIVFAPYGLAFPLIFKKRNFLRDIGICFLFSLFIELLQLFTTIGSFATVDLITNTAGYFIGYAAYKWVVSKLSVKAKVCLLWGSSIFLVGVLIFATVRTAQSMDVIIGVLTRTIE